MRGDGLLGCLDDVGLGDAELLVQDGGGRACAELVDADVLALEANVPGAEAFGKLHSTTCLPEMAKRTETVQI